MSFVIFVLGLCCGSFVNMLIFRTAIQYGIKIPNSKFQETNKSQDPNHNKQTLGNRSVCDFCGKQLNWFDNIPVISWLVLKGKSRCCNQKIDSSYPIVELVTGILFLFNFYFLISNFYSIFNFEFLIFNLITVFVIFSAFFDLKWMILPDFSTVILIILAIIYQIVGQPRGLPVHFIYSAMGAAGFLYFLYLITKGKGMGFGDVKFAIFMGLFLGWPKIMVAFYVAFIVGAIVGLISIILKKKKLKSEVPFGPFLIFGTVVASYWGKNVIDLLYKWF